MRPNQEELDLLKDLAQHEGFKLFLKQIEYLAQSLNTDMIRLTLETVASERELIRKKLKADGAHKLVGLISNYAQSLRPHHKG